MAEVVVTGIGIVCPLGYGVENFRKRMFAGDSGISAIRGSWVEEDFPVPHCGLIDRVCLPAPKAQERFDWSKAPKSWLFTALSLEEALENQDRDLKFDGLVYGTADGISFDLIHDSLKQTFDHKAFDERCTRSESPLLVIQELLEEHGFGRLADERLISLNSACASGNQTLGVAYQRIKSGEWTRCIAGGVDARCEPSNLLNFFLLGALTVAEVPSAQASRPFSLDRAGFVRGEASATLILESREAAEARGAKIYGTVAGYGMTSDAYRLTDGRDDGLSVVEAMRRAVEDSGLSLNDIDYISAHGTSTPLNDRLETKAIKTLFGEQAYKIPVSSIKSQIGHSTIAAGSVEAIASLIMLQDQKLAPTINLDTPDPDCDLDYVPNTAREARVKNILSNSLGFGGQNACLVFKSWDQK
jgi:3-oxoacyl-[acyl-carrier-protein] synthase II